MGTFLGNKKVGPGYAFSSIRLAFDLASRTLRTSVSIEKELPRDERTGTETEMGQTSLNFTG